MPSVLQTVLPLKAASRPELLRDSKLTLSWYLLEDAIACTWFSSAVMVSSLRRLSLDS